MSIERAQRRIAEIGGVAGCSVREASDGTPWTRTILVVVELRRSCVGEAGAIAREALRALRETHPDVRAGRLRVTWRDEHGIVHATRPREWLDATALEGARSAATDLVFTRSWLDEAVPA